MPKKKTAYEKVYQRDRLYHAWQQVYQSGLASDNPKTRNEVRNFNKDLFRKIRTISSQLQKRQFIFSNNSGYLKGEKRRPIVQSSVEGRIVQRSILNVLQEDKNLKPYYRNNGSFGAIESQPYDDKGVEAAIRELSLSIGNGSKYYYKSDIKQFFTKIPRSKVINTIFEIIDDSDFKKILDDATNLKIANINTIKKDSQVFFDYSEKGVPQGCSLSALFGNIILKDFDHAMNFNDITCIRYLDDFIVLAPDERSVRRIFNKGLNILRDFGFDAYVTGENNTKAKCSSIDKSFDFLGIEINGKTIRPSRIKKINFLNDLKIICKDGIKRNFNTRNDKNRNYSMSKTLTKVNNKILGWGNQYAFCNDQSFFDQMDNDINEIISYYLNGYRLNVKKLDTLGRRRHLGVNLISESKSRPIIM